MRIERHRLLGLFDSILPYHEYGVVTVVDTRTVEALAAGDYKPDFVVAVQARCHHAAVVEHGDGLALAVAEEHYQRRGEHQRNHQHRHEQRADDKAFSFYALKVFARDYYA